MKTTEKISGANEQPKSRNSQQTLFRSTKYTEFTPSTNMSHRINTLRWNGYKVRTKEQDPTVIPQKVEKTQRKDYLQHLVLKSFTDYVQYQDQLFNEFDRLDQQFQIQASEMQRQLQKIEAANFRLKQQFVLYAEKKIRDMSMLLKDEFVSAKQSLNELELEVAQQRIMLTQAKCMSSGQCTNPAKQ